MPVAHRLQARTATNTEVLLDRLYQEWHSPQEDPNAPLIIEESSSDQSPVNHLYVIWEDWAGVTPLERSKVILQAYERHRGRDVAEPVTLAMGVTSTEAELLGINLN